MKMTYEKPTMEQALRDIELMKIGQTRVIPMLGKWFRFTRTD